MNERLNNNKIYLLAKEAGLIEFEKLAWNPELQSPTYESVAKARKFAELIVRECVKEIEFQYGGCSDQPMDNEWDRAIECVSSMVKYRFGVEE